LKITFIAKPIKAGKSYVVKMPQEMEKEIISLGEDDDFSVTISIRRKGMTEITKRVDLLDEIHHWMIGNSKTFSDTGFKVSPRTISVEFGISIDDAVLYLSMLEGDGKAISEESNSGITFRLVKN
jgi:hypothetical protein